MKKWWHDPPLPIRHSRPTCQDLGHIFYRSVGNWCPECGECTYKTWSKTWWGRISPPPPSNGARVALLSLSSAEAGIIDLDRARATSSPVRQTTASGEPSPCYSNLNGWADLSQVTSLSRYFRLASATSQFSVCLWPERLPMTKTRLFSLPTSSWWNECSTFENKCLSLRYRFIIGRCVDYPDSLRYLLHCNGLDTRVTRFATSFEIVRFPVGFWYISGRLFQIWQAKKNKK